MKASGSIDFVEGNRSVLGRMTQYGNTSWAIENYFRPYSASEFNIHLVLCLEDAIQTDL